MFNLCIFKDILGKPGEGIHSYRIFGLAAVDLILTFFVALVPYLIFRGNYFIYLLLFFLLGIVLHRLFCVKTTVDKLLFGE